MAWTWEAGTPRERADMVRSHARLKKPPSNEYLCHIFQLTPEGLDEIVKGADWNQRFSTASPSPSAVEPT